MLNSKLMRRQERQPLKTLWVKSRKYKQLALSRFSVNIFYGLGDKLHFLGCIRFLVLHTPFIWTNLALCGPRLHLIKQW